MGEPYYVGPPTSENQQEITLENLKVAIVEKWGNIEVEIVNQEDIDARWSVNSDDWYLNCILIRKYSLSIQSNDGHIVADTVLWFYSLNPETKLYLYNAHTASNPLRLTEDLTLNDVLDWMKKS